KPTKKDTRVPQSSGPTESVVDEAVHKEFGDRLVRATTTASSLDAKQDSGNITKTQSKATPNEPSFQGTNLGGGPRCNTLQSDEDSLKLDESMALCTTLQNKVLDLEKTTTTQRNEIASLKRRVKKLKKKNSTAATTVTITTEEITLAQALKVLKTSKPKVKGIVFLDPGKSTTTITIISSQQSQDKGKGIMIEEHVKPKKKDQTRLDKEAAKKLQAKFDEEERLAREKAEKEKRANIALIKYGMIFKQRLMLIISWLKDCKNKNKKKQSWWKEKKRAREELVQEITKKQKVEDDKEKVKLKQLMETIPDKEEVAIDAIPLAVKSPRIVDWKIHKERKKSYY
nr:hypothetical protein [Tanacetum cinerariifolium]